MIKPAKKKSMVWAHKIFNVCHFIVFLRQFIFFKKSSYLVTNKYSTLMYDTLSMDETDSKSFQFILVNDHTTTTI